MTSTPGSGVNQCGIMVGIIRVLLALMVMFSLTVTTCHATVVNRVNYGVIFTKEATAGVAYDYWTHTVRMPIPHIQKHKRMLLNCHHSHNNSYNRHCLPYRMVYESVDVARETYLNTLNESLTHILQMMPSHKASKSRSRSARAPLGFIGDISHSLFGTARVKDVKLLAHHIQALEAKSSKTLSQMAEFTDNLSSFIQISTNRYSKLKTAVKDNHLAVVNMAQDINNLEQTIYRENRMSTIMLSLFIEELYHTINLQAGLTDFLEGVHDLMRHKLSRHIIPHGDMVNIIDDINDKLHRHDTRLIVMPMKIPDLYNFVPFVWTHRSSGLYVTIKFPLVLFSMGRFDIYKVITFAVPLNQSSQHATVLTDFPDYIGFSQDNMYYGFPSKDMINGPFIDAQTANLPLYPLTHTSCITAIYFDDKQTIKELCDFRVTLHSIKPEIIHLHHGKYLILNVTNMFQKCPSGRQQIQGCPFCVYSVPCFCDLATDKMYFPPRLTHCTRTNGSVSPEHSVNLAMLLHIFEMDEVKHIKADDQYSQIPLVDTPPLKLFQHNFSELIAQDKTEDLSLKRIAQSVKDEKVVFQTLADPILDDLNDVDDDTSLLSWNSLLTLVNAAVLAVLIIAGCYFYYKIRLLTAAFAVLQQAQRASTQEVLNTKIDGIYLIPPTTTTPNLPQIYITVHDDTLVYVLVAFACALICFIAYKLLTKQSRLASISVEISSGKSCILLPMIILPFCPKFYHCQIERNFSNIKVTGILQPQFSWDHGSLKITNLIDQTNLTVPNQFTILFWQGLKLRVMLRKTIYCYLVAEHGKHAFHLKLCPVSCQTCVATTNAVEAPAQNTIPMPLYPELSASETEEHSSENPTP